VTRRNQSVASCPQQNRLPSGSTTRSYTATVAQSGSTLDVRLSGADFVVTQGRGDHFSGFVGPNDDVAFTIGSPTYYYYYCSAFDVVERLTNNTALIVNGNVTASATSAGISGTLIGSFILAQGLTNPSWGLEVICRGGTHRFEMVRR
jgi:hypothetical protein